MTDPHLLGALSRIADALERHVDLLHEALDLVREIAGDRSDNQRT